MKKIICFIFLTLGIVSCSSSDDAPKAVEATYEFIAPYKGNIYVGGFVGVWKRDFKIGETYKGTEQGENVIVIKTDCKSIASEPCVAGDVEVPKEFLKLVK